MKDMFKVGEFTIQRMDGGECLVTSDGGLALRVLLVELLREVFADAFSDENVTELAE